MGRIPDSFLDDLLARTDIVEVIEARVPLKRAGREHRANCPFHDERTPSFWVSPQKQFYHCFGCGAHGTAIRFLMEYDRMEFLDAVEELAQRAGVTVPREARAGSSGEFNELYDVCEAATRWFQRNLAASDKAKAYFDRRGVDEANVRRFALGYAPDAWDGLKTALGTDAQRLKALEKAGLLTHGDRGTYDKFRDRVMFPIHDRRGRVIAFGGRVLGADDGPKYLNSPETPLFHKGRELFGLHQARQANSKLSRLVVVEGYMDVIALFQYGVTQAVATLGTATTKDHAELLFRNSADVVFCFDGDRAGRSAAWRAVESVLPRLKEGRQALFLFLPEGEDPDTIVRAEGLDGVEARVRDATPLSEFFYAELSKDVNLASIDGKARLAERAKPFLGAIPDGAFRDLMHARLGEITGLGAAPAARPAPPPAVMRPRANAPAQRSIVRAAIELLVQQPALVQELEPPYIFYALDRPGIALLRELIELCRARPDITTGALLEHFEGRDDYAALAKLALADLMIDPSVYPDNFRGAIAKLNSETEAQRRGALLDKQAEGALSDADKQELRELLAAKGRPAAG
ncbi:MAG TPA: DNA primase [Candidatus Saccharimonadia bacterium]|nr:DNA primase [Candidatus Saccharimonadia bacterium]